MGNVAVVIAQTASDVSAPANPCIRLAVLSEGRLAR